MIDWINTNSNVLLVVLTAIYVFTTIAILMVMAKSNKLSQKSIEQTGNLEREKLRPYLSIELKITKSGEKDSLPYGYILLRNTGSTQARHVTIEMEPVIFSTPTVGGEKKKKIPYFIENKTEIIPPNVELSDSIGFLPSIFENFDVPIFKGTINYEDASNRKYQEPFTINLNSMRLATPYIRDIIGN